MTPSTHTEHGPKASGTRSGTPALPSIGGAHPGAAPGEERAKSFFVAGSYFTVILEDERNVTVPLDWYPRLAVATPEQQREYQIVSGGRALHWPGIDEDIRVSDLLEGKASSESPVHLRSWYEQHQRPVWEQRTPELPRLSLLEAVRASRGRVLIGAVLSPIVLPTIFVVAAWRRENPGVVLRRWLYEPRGKGGSD